MKKKYLIFTLIVTFLIVIFSKFLNIDQFILEYIKLNQYKLLNFSNNHYIISIALFIITYVLISLLPIPGDSILAMIGGFLFGAYQGLIFSLISVTISSSIIFFIIKVLIKKKLNFRITKKIENLRLLFKNNITYFLLIIRLLPLMPLFVTNTIASLSTNSYIQLVLTTIIGMTPIISIYSFAGTKLNQISALNQILTIPLILTLISFCFIIISPLIIKKIKKLKKK